MLARNSVRSLSKRLLSSTSGGHVSSASSSIHSTTQKGLFSSYTQTQNGRVASFHKMMLIQQQNQQPSATTTSKTSSSPSSNNNNNTTTAVNSTTTAGANKPTTTTLSQQQKQQSGGSGSSSSNKQQQGGSKSGSMFKTVLISSLLTGAVAAGVVFYINNSLQAMEKDHAQQAKTAEKLKREIQAKKLQQEQAKSKLSSLSNELEELEKQHTAKLLALKDSYNNKMNLLQEQLKELVQKVSSLEQEKRELSENLERNIKLQQDLLSEKEALQSEKNILEQQLNSLNSLQVRSSGSIISDVLGREIDDLTAPLSEEDRDKFLSRIHRLETQLAKKEKLIEQIKHESEESIHRMKALTEEKLASLKKESEENIATLQNQMEELQKKHAEDLEAERRKILDEFELNMQRQAHDLLMGFYDNALQRSKHVQELTNQVYAMEETYKVASSNFSSNIDLQKFAAAVLALQDILQTSAPFKPELDTLKKLAENDELIRTVVETIPRSISENGVQKLDDLTERFKVVKRKAIEASLTPHDSGLLGVFYAKLLSLAVVAEEGFVDGETLNAIMARTEFYLQQRRLVDAVNEIDKTQHVSSEEVKRILQDWVLEAKNRLLIDQALQTLQSHLVVQSHSLEKRQQ
ncbi:hypothetical protein FDP41_012048 [Naegleria fowleri]|uniref:Mitofilin n=1 Tax=Naegleria fowleri TaxID=5763 RepID=A0A6A5BY28_NAEFO|nr:uncharacterized protein FDP41_012048 [Naegleria fowleri]KAF0982187.1 hypothetical protein FDP41_012048 [Naegleria fowleri]CAG4717770.1 unnamed protein product [Naegleria fowleri]